MTKANITQYDSTPSNNADINDINIAENCPASNINNAIRELMAHLKNVDTGSQALTALSVTGNTTLTGALSAKGGAVFNQDSADVDFRVESNNNTHALFVDGGNDKIGMFTDSPSAKLHIKTNSSGGTAQSRSALVIEDDGGNADSIQFLTNDSGFQSIFLEMLLTMMLED